MSERRVALVTGGARRVGRAIVRKLAANQFDVAFTYFSSSTEADSLRAELIAAGGRAIAIKADFNKPPAAVDAVEAAVRDLGRLDVLVNNASSFEAGSLAEVTPAQLQRMMAVHVEVPLLLCQRLAPLLRAGHGHVINMLDLMVERPAPGYLAYSASKAALANLTLGLARELAPDVTVNGIAPGVIEWPQDYPPAERERYLRRVPLGRAGTPDDAAEVVLFLSRAGSYLTGQILRLDGGRSIT